MVVVAPLALACVYGALLAGWMHWFFLRPLTQEAWDMVRACAL